MEFLLANWQPILGGIGSAVGIGTWIWGRRVKKVLEAFTKLIMKIIDSRKDGIWTDKEIKAVMDLSVKALVTLFPFYRRHMKKPMGK